MANKNLKAKQQAKREEERLAKLAAEKNAHKAKLDRLRDQVDEVVHNKKPNK